jgi:hypothetical protein
MDPREVIIASLFKANIIIPCSCASGHHLCSSVVMSFEISFILLMNAYLFYMAGLCLLL